MHKLKSFFTRNSTDICKSEIFFKIQNETDLNTKQIKDFYRTFKSNSENGVMNIRRFRVVLGLLDDGLLSQMIFNAMDINNDRVLDFYEFSKSLGIMISNNFDEKARFSYRIIKGGDSESSNDEGITLQKLLASIRAIDNARYTLVGPHTLTFPDKEIENFFKNYSTLIEGESEYKIYLDNYKSAIQESPEFLSFFGIITPNILDSSELEFDRKGFYSLFEIINSGSRTYLDKIENSELKEKEINMQLKLQVYNLIENVKDIKEKVTNSIEKIQNFIQDVDKDQNFNFMMFGYNNSSLVSIENQEKVDNQKLNFINLQNDLILFKSSLENNIEVFDAFYKKNLFLQNKSLNQVVSTNAFPNLSLMRKVCNRKKMYINKGNVAPNTKHRISASEMIKKTFMNKSSNSLEHNFGFNSKKSKKSSLIHIYRHKNKVGVGYQNMNKIPSVKNKPSNSKNFLQKTSKTQSIEKDSPSIKSQNNLSIKKVKGYIVYIGHESWNTVLNMMIGMRLAIGRVYSEPNRKVADYDFIMKEKFFIIPRTSHVPYIKQSIQMQKMSETRKFGKPVQFIDYNPMVFRKIREICQISPESYIRSVGPEQLLGNMVLGNLSSMNELCSEGKSGAFFYYTTDGRFLIKTVEKKTASFFRNILSRYYRHIESNPNSLITRIYGLHALRFKKPLLQPFHSLKHQISNNHSSIITKKSKIYKIFFIVMENIFHTPVEIHRRYDIKGSWIGRSTPLILQADKTIALKELDMKNRDEKLNIDKEIQKNLLQQLEVDCQFFNTHNIMDYSLLIGIHYVEDDDLNIKSIIENHNSRKFVGIPSTDFKKVYYLGFIDFFSTWNTMKKLERLYKTIIIGSSTGISAVPPNLYASRFIKFMKSRLIP